MNYDPKMNILNIKDQLAEDYKLKVSSNLQVGEADNAADNPVFVQITNPSDIEATLAAETTKVIGTVNDKIADGDDISLGAKADPAATVGDITPFSVIALLKGIWNKLGSVVLSTSSAIIGNVGIDQTTDGTTNKVQARNTMADNFAVNANMQMADADVSVSNPLATKDISIPSTPTIYNVTMTTLNTEYSQVLPANCKKFAMKVQLGTGAYKYRVAYVTGKVATPTAPYILYNDDQEYAESGLNATPTLYFASTASGLVMQIIAWV